MIRHIGTALLLATLFLSGCSGLPLGQPAPSTLPSATATDTPAPVETATQEPSSSPTPGPVTLLLWVPPQFDPAGGAPGADLLQGRLDAFAKRRPGVRVEVRVKALEGAGGMLEALSAASVAAPLAMPDLVAMPRYLMETAALSGLLHPYDNLTEALDSMDWYDYAREMAYVQNSLYGLPIAGDAQVMVYSPAEVQEPPEDWAMTIEAGVPLVFPGADPQAIFTLTMYQAIGGMVVDEAGQPFLDAELLSQVLAFYAEAEAAGVMPYWVTQYQSDEQVWEAFLEDRTGQAVTRASNYLVGPPDDLSITKLPTPGGTPYALASGWVWTLSTPSAQDQQLSVELAEFLSDEAFLAQWAGALGYLPVHPGGLPPGSDQALSTVIEQVSRSATIFPPMDIWERLSLPLQQATVDVLKQQADPVTAAQSAAASLATP
jgi:ABC-type glycerol-3-phosphate transport system substrate-binding protein